MFYGLELRVLRLGVEGLITLFQGFGLRVGIWYVGSMVLDSGLRFDCLGLRVEDSGISV